MLLLIVLDGNHPRPSGKASASTAEDTGIVSQLSRVESYLFLQTRNWIPSCAVGILKGRVIPIGTPVAALQGAWRYRVSTGTGRPGVSIL